MISRDRGKIDIKDIDTEMIMQGFDFYSGHEKL